MTELTSLGQQLGVVLLTQLLPNWCQYLKVFAIFPGFRISATKIGQNYPFAFWQKWLNFEYSREKCYFSANRRWFFSLVFVLTQRTINFASDKPIFTKSDKHFLFFEASEVQLWKSAKIGPLHFGKNGWILSTRGKNAIFQLIGVGFC